MPEEAAPAQFLNADPDLVREGKQTTKSGIAVICVGVAGGVGVLAYVGGALGRWRPAAGIALLVLGFSMSIGLHLYRKGTYLMHGNVLTTNASVSNS